MLFRSVLFNFQAFWYSPATFLLLISSFIPPWRGSILCMISVLLNLLRCFLRPRMWSVLVKNRPCELKKDVDSAACCWMKCSRDVSRILLIRGIVEFSYVFIDWIPAGSVSYWQRHGGVSVRVNSIYSCSAAVLPHIACHSVLGAYGSRTAMYSWRTDPLVLCNICLDPKCSCSDVYIVWN